LTIAAELGDIDIINLLLDAGAEYMTDKRDTALHVAAQTNRDDIAKVLIDKLGCVERTFGSPWASAWVNQENTM
jgi:ankyrin repeat protein